MDQYVNPPEALAAEAERRREERKQSEEFPSQPARDVMLFVLENAPLKPWQADVLSIIRDDSLPTATWRGSSLPTPHGRECGSPLFSPTLPERPRLSPVRR